MNRFLFGGLLSRASIDDTEPGGAIVESNYAAPADIGPAVAPQPGISVINPAEFHAVDVWGGIVPDAARWDDNHRIWGSSNGATYVDLIDVILQEYDYSIGEDQAKAIALQRYPYAQNTINRLDLINWWILGTDAQFGAAWNPPAVASPVAAPAPAFYTPPSSVPTEPDPYFSAPVSNPGGSIFTPAPAPAPTAPVFSAPIVGLSPTPAPSPVAPAPATSTTLPGVTSGTSTSGGGGVYSGWTDTGGGGVPVGGDTSAPAPATSGNGRGALILAALAALAYLNS